MRFEVRSGDCGSFVAWDDCSTHRERKELRQGDNINVGENWYHWSIYLPEDYPRIWQARFMYLGQFHNKGHYTPTIMFRVIGELESTEGKYDYIEHYTVRNFMDRFQSAFAPGRLINLEDMRGKWSDFLIHVRWSAGDKGFLRETIYQCTPRYPK